MKIMAMRYDVIDGDHVLRMVVTGNCEEEIRKAEHKLDSGGEVEFYFANGKRSLDANAFYWILTTRIAKALNVPLAEAHNRNLSRYGVPLLVDNKCVYAYLPDTTETEKSVLQNETVHMRATSNVTKGRNGMFRAYMVMKGSSEMDTEEFSRLVDGVIDECKQMGVDYRKPWER